MKTKLQNKLKELWNDKLGFVLLGILVIQVLFIVCINLFKCDAYLDIDMAKLYRHTLEYIRNGSFLIPDWEYTSTAEFDCSAIIAIPMYMLTGKMGLSFGIGNIVFMALYIFVLFDIMKNFEMKLANKCIVVLIFLAPYRVGYLDYANMLLFNGGQYVMKVLVSLLLLDLLVQDDLKKEKTKNIVLFVLLNVNLFITGLSSGTFVTIMGVFPLILCYALNILLKGDIKKIDLCKAGVIVLTLLTSGISIVLRDKLGFETYGGNYMFTETDNLIESVDWYIRGLLGVFLDMREVIDVMSLNGIMYAIKALFVFVFIGLLIYSVVRLVKFKEEDEKKRYFYVPIVWNVFMLILLGIHESNNIPCRYNYSYVIPAFILVGLLIESYEMLDNKLMMNVLKYCTLAYLVLIVLICDKKMLEKINEPYAEARAVVDFAEDYGVDTILFLENYHDQEVARYMNPDMYIGCVKYKEEFEGTPAHTCIENRDFYFSYDDMAVYDNPHILAVSNYHQYDALPEYLRSSYILVGEVRPGYPLYYSGDNKFDGNAGFPVGTDRSIDLCYTEDYERVGELDLYGYLVANGQQEPVLISPKLESPDGKCDITLRYDCENSNGAPLGLFVLCDEGLNVISQAELKPDEEAVMISSDKAQGCYLYVIVYPGQQARIKRIEFQK
ncbi:MAG: hypothetical protein Q4D29_11385 [Lachnospiraceae bacterium]|nr:hypothetical protein [Lachnospiraceae bacterium]